MAFLYETVRHSDPSRFPPIRVESPLQRHHSWTADLKRAEQYVIETTMLWRFGQPETNLVRDELLQVAQRGISTTLHIADIMRLLHKGESEKLLPQNPFSSKLKDWREEFEREVQLLRNGGINVNVNNPGTSIFREMFPWTGTDHRKNASVDGRVATMKDNNFGDGSFEMLSYALTGEDPGTVEAIERQIGYSQYVDVNGIYVDNRPPLDLVTLIPGQPFCTLMDRGDRGISVMMDTALDLTRVDGPALHANQYAPTGRLAKAIKERAKREQPTLVITSAENAPENIKTLSGKGIAALKWARDTKDNPYISTLYHEGKVHSKAYLVLVRGGVIGLVGTNNLNDVGIWAGTQENGLFIFEPCSLGNELWYRHLEDATQILGHPAPFSQTRHENVFTAERFRAMPNLEWN